MESRVKGSSCKYEMPSKGIAQTYSRGFFIFSIKDDSELIVALFIDIIWMAVCAGSGDPPEPEELIVALQDLENSASSDAEVRSG